MTIFFDFAGALFASIREHLEPLLFKHQFRLYAVHNFHGTFGNRRAEYRESHGHRTVEIIWDGKDGVLLVGWSPSFREPTLNCIREEPIDRHTVTADDCEELIGRLLEAVAKFLVPKQ